MTFENMNLEVIALLVSVAGFFLSLRYAVTRIIEAISAMPEKISEGNKALADKINEGNERLAKQIERMGTHAAQDHAALTSAVDKLVEQNMHGQEKLLEAMNLDHREMSSKIGGIETVTAKMDAKLDAHISDDRRK